jgi:hypothetical protein
MQRRFLWLAMAALSMSTACGGSSSTAPTNTNTHTNTNSARSMSAKVDGTAWTATTVGAGVTGGIAILVGTNVTQSVSISFVPTVGTQTMTPTGIVIGQVTIGGQTWQATGTAGSSGSVTVATATASHVVGTFSFTAPPLGGTGATRQVTAGTFDVTF